ncbi:ion transporter [Blastococcus sp. CT_GayMR19]|uniref:ArsA family ATPase n=1 Tax=Blastococcus sp. CT_GayMR19 TaxID=2559608 RepID=UPI00107306C6|nr:ArsA-related P-loop ATPase [Blastococcus sp. CT_GayMR19]TFV79131.1 ion transporter [Blastococcus sp. CT_GayMR19]
MRTLLFTGPGGAGTTTMAASAAVRAARAGRRTVLLSRQDVPGLGDVPRLEVVRVDQQAALERFWGGLAEGLGPVLPQLTLPPSSSVVPLPGGADLALFAELAGADADLVVLDAGPVESAAAFVALPATLRWWLDQLFPPGMRALGAVRTAAVGSGALRRGPVDAALAAIPVLEGLLAADRLAVRADTAVCLVALPTSAGVDRLRTAVTTLALHGLRPAAVLTRVPPSEGTGEWAAARAADRDAALAAFAELAEVRQVPEGAVGPVDADGLAELLEGFAPGPGAPPPAPGPERRDGAWQLSLPLPFAHRGDVTLTRWMDDLVVTVGGARRCLALDPLLRRCEVTGGRLVDPGGTDARLEVGFRPDPQQWPADLLAADERTP